MKILFQNLLIFWRDNGKNKEYNMDKLQCGFGRNIFKKSIEIGHVKLKNQTTLQKFHEFSARI